MKKSILLAVFLCLSLFIPGQTVDTSIRNYDVIYAQGHLFLQKGDGFNVVDYDVEWPDIVSYSDVITLKHYISEEMFGYPTTSLDTAIMSLNGIYGERVSGKFKTIPDDNRFCYVEATARLLSYQPGRWIAYKLRRTVKPEKLSSYKPEETDRVIVYDLTSQRVMLANDMIKKGVMQWGMPGDFYDKLFEPLADDFFYNLTSVKINGVWIGNGQIHLLVDVSATNDSASYSVSMPYEGYSYILSKDVRRMVEKELKPQQPQLISLPVTLKGDSVYDKVEQMPEFKGGQEGLRGYLSTVSKPACSVSKVSRVYVSFVVDKEGNVCDVSVVSPVSPEIDRHAVSVIKGMPKFTPGKQNGKEVCVRLFMPVTYMP